MNLTRAGVLMRHRFRKFMSLLARRAFSAALRTVITGLVFGVCAMLVMRYLGVPLPTTDELLHNLESITRLAGILS